MWEESRNIGREGVLLGFDSEAELTVLEDTFSVPPITWNTIFQLLQIFKELKLTLEPVTLRAESDDASLGVSCAVTQGLPAFQVYPTISNIQITQKKLTKKIKFKSVK